jgi:hypothetical protein
MPWTLARLTDDLTADGAWHGLDRYDTAAPDSQGEGSIFFPVGGSGALVTRDQEVLLRVAWCTTTGGFVAGAGTSCTVEPVTIDRLPHPVSGSLQERLSVGEARAAELVDDPGLLGHGHVSLWLGAWRGPVFWAKPNKSPAPSASRRIN